ncbi:hypothetical protein HK105_206895 [Polyrhizophydium stewartii]|uniref:Cleavage stimulation factor 50 kDa subunit n=1 Tax=Polyrhizophydium stewartii TaxID=2732419 RepID=A0ABR4N289_9FUNG|nr:cleavage stimulation factor, 3' pre-RNA, subunit 1 [Polyrhizophydium stewartii]
MFEADDNSRALPAAQLLPLIVSQLKFYGYTAAAKFVADTTEVSSTFEPSARLAELCFLGRQAKEAMGGAEEDLLAPAESLEPAGGAPGDELGALAIDPAAPAAYSADGKLAATGSQDTTIKILDAHRIATQLGDSAEDRKVLRTLYDHQDAINDLAFHPNGFVLASGADDCQIKLFDMQKTHVKRGFRYLSDAYPVRSIAFHPSGDFLLSGTDHHAVRIYDVHTLKCFTPQNQADHHRAGILKVAYAPTGGVFASASADGDIRLYDTVSGRCINTIAGAHGGRPVTSVAFSKNSKYLLSMGMDSVGRLWDMGSGKTLVTYQGSLQSSEKTGFVFNHNEDFVFGADAANSCLVVWDSRSGTLLRRFSGHGKPVLAIAASPTDNCLITGSEDTRARVWGSRE